MSSVEHHIDVAVRLPEAYDVWTRFEQLPRFMEGVEEIRQLDETHLHWRASYDGIAAEWDCEIVEQRPEERIAWRSTSGLTHGGVVTFHPLDDHVTRVMIMAEVADDAAPIVELRVKQALDGFRAMMERP
ncbi:MAG TPA: SRPBCC family protein [Solirubrobacteraceae bacterium]|nr:SRPBCC family protein [Solirubrobacteraceae bacterium]